MIRIDREFGVLVLIGTALAFRASFDVLAFEP
jgi:hypothetical protein